jgi:hypothetical protein
MSFGQNIAITAPVALFAAIITWPTEDGSRSEPVAKEYARMFKGVFPRTSEDGTHFSAPTVEGETLIFTIAPSEDISEGFSGRELEQLTVNATCESGKGLKRLFKNGGKLRIDIDVDGAVHRGKERLSC